jgi:hypothetical protein
MPSYRDVLSGMPALRGLAEDPDVFAYVAGLLAEDNVNGVEAVTTLAGPFFESFGVDPAALPRLCEDVWSRCVEAGLKAVRKAGYGAGAEVGTSARAMAKAMLAASEGAGAGVLLGGGSLTTMGDDPTDVGEGATAVRVLAAPVKLGDARSLNTSSLDFLWGKESARTAYLSQTSVIDYEASRPPGGVGGGGGAGGQVAVVAC